MADESLESTRLSRERTSLSRERTDLSIERTLLSHERTLMAWVRTATALISFGFTIYKFFEYLDESGRPNAHRHLGPREFAMAMIGIGLTALVLATIDHHQRRASLRAAGAHVPRSLAFIMAILVAALGIGGLVLAFLRR